MLPSTAGTYEFRLFPTGNGAFIRLATSPTVMVQSVGTASLACVSATTGNWNSPGTWTSCGGRVPGTGDTSEIHTGHTVTITSGNPVTVGTDPNPAAAVLIIRNGGILVAQANLTIRGDVAIEEGGTLKSLTGGVRISLDSPTAGLYYTIHPVALTATAAAVIDLEGPSATSRVTLAGMGAVDRGGGHGAISSTAVWASMVFTHVTLDSLGASGQPAINLSSYSTGPITWTDVYQTNCGQVVLSSQASNLTLNIAGWDIRNLPAFLNGDFSVWLTDYIAKSGGTRSITGLTVYHTNFYNEMRLQVSDLTVDGVLFDTVLTFLEANSTFHVLHAYDMALATEIEEIQLPGAANVTIEQSAFLTSHSVNAHNIYENGNRGGSRNLYQDNVFDAFGSGAGANNMLLVQAPITAQRNILINAAAALMEIHNVTEAPIVKHNTQYMAGDGMIEAEMVGIPATVMKTLTNNIFMNDQWGLYQKALTWNRQSTFVMDYNGFFGMGGSQNLKDSGGHLSYVQFPTVGVPVNATMTTSGTTPTIVKVTGANFVKNGVLAGDWIHNASVMLYAQILSVDSETQVTLKNAIPGMSGGQTISVRMHYVTGAPAYGEANFGQHDVYGDPAFTDPTVTALRYVAGATSLIDCVQEFVKLNGRAFDGTLTTPTTYTRQGLLAYIRNGFTPRNAIFHAAGDTDVGGWIGAVPGR
jgi:hypothetical protein